MKNIQIIDLLAQRFPDFIVRYLSDTDLSESNIHYIFGCFGDYLCNMTLENQKPLVLVGFDFINELLDTGNSDVENILCIEIFELFFTNREMFEFALIHLNPSGVQLMQNIKQKMF